MNLTPRQLDVIVAIRNYRHLHGYSPTMQELADQLGTSKVTIFEHVGALEKKRVLRRDKHKARSLEITADEKLPDEERSTKLPLLGGKPTYGFVTYAIDPGKTLDKLSAVLAERGADVQGAMTIRRDKNVQGAADLVDRLVAAVEETSVQA